MKKKIFSLFSGIFLPVCFFAQSTAIIGTGTSTNSSFAYPAPYGNFFWGAKHQILVLASELTAAGMTAGNITAIAFDVATPAGTPLNNFTILMKNTSSTSVSTAFDNTGLTTVFGPQTYTETSGWSTHILSTPFSWNGTSNILIQTCFQNSSWTQNAQMRFTTTSYNSVVYYFQDMNNVCSQFNGTTSMDRPNIRFTYIPNGPPTAQFTANPTVSCNGTVQFIDQSFFNITAWNWNFGDGGTSTVQNPVYTYTASGVYPVTLTVTNANGSSTVTQPNYITVNLGAGLPAPSCTPQTTAYCCGFGITNFTFNNINNTSNDGSEGYADFSCMVDTVLIGQSYNISVTTQTPASHNVRVWIDWNNDGTFNPSTEEVFAADNSLIASGNVLIPGSATLNVPLRLRVSADHSLQPVPTPCSNLTYGQAEDYGIYVKPNTSPPVADFKADDTVSCTGIVQFTDLSTNLPFAWNWDFGDGNISSLQNPTNTYTVSGLYAVSLTVTNTFGTDTEVKSNYINVTLGNTPVPPSCQPATFSYCCGYGIYKVIFNTISKSSQDAVEGYQDFSCTDQTTLNESQTYTLSIQTSTSNTQDTKVWIDYNNDGIFTSPAEEIFSSLSTINPSGNITIPSGVAVLNTLLRMRVSSDNGGSNPGPCTSLIRGQAEDYAVIILPPISITEESTAATVAVYPNPFSESAILRITDDRITNCELKIYDVYGKEIKTKVTRNSVGFVIYRENIPAGIYFYTLEAPNATIHTGKLIIE